MSSPATAQAASVAPVNGATDGPTRNRFHIAALAFQRARQLQNGARPRVDPGGHKPTRLALLEVMADTISWTLT